MGDTEQSLEHGLSSAQANLRLVADGPNELPTANPKGLGRLVFEVVREPMFLLLIACGTLYLIMGDARDALMLLGFVVVVMAITFLQHRRTERALEALRDLSSPRALVVRDETAVRIPGREVVRGDHLLVREGDRIPADAVLVAGQNITVDESLLTGESVPVEKMPNVSAPDMMGKPGGEDTCNLFSGTLVVQGSGTARVVATGSRTAIGNIGAALASVKEEQTRVQRDTGRVVRIFAIFGATLSAVIAMVYGITRGDWLNGFLAGITTAMAILPEELPVILTIFLGLGAWRISQKKILTRRMPAIEMLGAATVLCTDKTGTLTENRMSISYLFACGSMVNILEGRDAPIEEDFHTLLEFATLAGHRDPHDPTEQAIVLTTTKFLAQTEHIHEDWRLIEEYPLSPDLRAMSRVWKAPAGTRYVIASKGAPEAVVGLCHLDAAATQAILRKVDEMASKGLRVLAVANAYFNGKDLPEIQHDFDFEFIGLIGLADPLRASVPAAVREARIAGIRVVMITGDYPATAMSIAEQAGIDTSGGSISSDEVDALDDATLGKRVQSVNVFCRMVPAHKLRLVNALKANGELVAMTGDGVNDAPALKSAHIGIAMGGRGTDVAREAAALVLVEDNFASIVDAIRLGRRIFDNLRKAITFVVAVHVPIVGLSFIPVVLGWPLLLMPIHVMFLQLVIDPVCSVVFEAEPEEGGIMHRPPSPPDSSIFDRHSIALGLFQGLVLLVVILAANQLAKMNGLTPEEARALAFSTLVLGALSLIFTNRSRTPGILATLRSPNMALWGIAIGTVLLLALALWLPPLQAVFHFGVLRPTSIWAIVLVGITCGVLFDLFKRLPQFRSS